MEFYEAAVGDFTPPANPRSQQQRKCPRVTDRSLLLKETLGSVSHQMKVGPESALSPPLSYETAAEQTLFRPFCFAS